MVAIKQGDKSILVPGKVAAISVVAGPDGHLVTPGLTIENETGGEVLDVAPAKPPPAKPGQTGQIIPFADLELSHAPVAALLAASLLAAPALAQRRGTSPNSAASASISPPWIRASSRATISFSMSTANG